LDEITITGRLEGFCQLGALTHVTSTNKVTIVFSTDAEEASHGFNAEFRGKLDMLLIEVHSGLARNYQRGGAEV